MDRNQAKQLLPVIQAFSEGRPIQYRIKDNKSAKWNDVDKNYHEFSPHSFLYRIKSEPKYRPFANAEECWQEMQKHQPFGWMKSRFAFVHIIYIEDKSIGYGSACGTILHDNFNSVLEGFTFADGTPFGIKEEE